MPEQEVIETEEQQTGLPEQIDGQHIEGEGEDVAPPLKKEDEVNLKAAMAKLAETVAQTQQPKLVEPELTEDQKKEFWAVYEPDKTQKDFFRKWFRLNPDATDDEVNEMKAMWAGVQTGLVKQAVTGSRRIMENELAKLKEELKPLHEYVEQQRTEGTRKRFYDKYDVLNDPKYQPIVQAHARALADKSFDNEDAFFKELAEGSAKTIKELVPDFDLGAVKQKEKPAGSTPRLPRSSVGGTGGTGKGQPVATGTGGDIDSLT